MKDIEFLNEVNDRVVLSVDEPIYQSTERFIHTMSEQLELSPQQIKDALDFQYLARRQRQLARPLIEAFVRSHPYAERMPAAQYAQELLQAHPGINASMVEAYFQEASKAADVATVETPEAPAAEATTEEAAVTPETVSSEVSSAGEVPASEPTDALEQAQKRVLAEIETYNPDMLCVSINTANYKFSFLYINNPYDAYREVKAVMDENKVKKDK